MVSTLFTDLLVVGVDEGQTEVVLLQQVEMLTHHVHQSMPLGMLLQKKKNTHRRQSRGAKVNIRVEESRFSTARLDAMWARVSDSAVCQFYFGKSRLIAAIRPH